MLGALYKLAKQRAISRRVVESEQDPARTKEAALPQYSPTPFSSLTARGDFINNRKYKPEPNQFTSDDQDLLNRLLGGMSHSRARVVGAGRKARGDVRSLLASSKLWS